MIRIPFFASLTLVAFALPLCAQDKPKKDEKAGKDAVSFESQVWPILEKRCVECHATPVAGPDGKMKKPKGGVILDSKDGITNGKKGKLVVAKKSGESKLVESITLAADHEDRMPPAKKGDPLSKDEIELIKKWIDGGADLGKWTGKKAEGGDKPKDGGKKEKDGEEKGKKG